MTVLRVSGAHVARCSNRKRNVPTLSTSAYATIATGQELNVQFGAAPPTIQRHAPEQPPSYKPPFLRKSQLHREYTSLIKSTPLMLLFQHNNLRAVEWAAIRRELVAALRRAASKNPLLSGGQTLEEQIRIKTIQTGIFAAALRVAEFYKPTKGSETAAEETQDNGAVLHNGLSEEAYKATLKPLKSKNKMLKPKKRNTPLHTLLHGPIAVVSFPSVTPAALASVLSTLSPTQGAASKFPAPRRRESPSYYEGPVQSGLQKLLLLGARVDGRTLDGEGVRWVGGIEGGVDGLRAQLVGLLNQVGMGLTSSLDAASNNLWITMEGRRTMLEAEASPPPQQEEQAQTS